MEKWNPQSNPNRVPHKEENYLVIRKAPEITFDSASDGWQLLNNEMNERIDRRNVQICVIAHHNDVTEPFFKDLNKQNPTSNPIAFTAEQYHPDGNLYMEIKNESDKAESIYIVSSAKTMEDINKVCFVADFYKTTLGKQYVTGLLPSVGNAREDKNVNKDGDKRPNVINIRVVMKTLKACGVDRAIIIEPHSSAAQAYAAELNDPMPIAPISAWKFMTDQVIKDGKITLGNTSYEINANTAVVVRPDVGRNLAAIRMQKYLGNLPGVAFKKKRLSPTEVIFEPLTREEANMLEDKILILFDDENESMGTIYGVLNEAKKYNAAGAFALFVHTKLTYGWDEKIKHPLLIHAFGSDSLASVGNKVLSNKLSTISLAPMLMDLLKADMEEENFWDNPQYKDTILQINGNIGETE